jgi:hypothetical protein
MTLRGASGCYRDSPVGTNNPAKAFGISERERRGRNERRGREQRESEREMVILTLGYFCYCCPVDNFDSYYFHIVNIKSKRLVICTLLHHANKSNGIEFKLRERVSNAERVEAHSFTSQWYTCRPMPM